MRTANIYEVEDVYNVDLFEDNVLVETKVLEGHSIFYAIKVVDNWINGIIKLSETSLIKDAAVYPHATNVLKG